MFYNRFDQAKNIICNIFNIGHIIMTLMYLNLF